MKAKPKTTNSTIGSFKHQPPLPPNIERIAHLPAKHGTLPVLNLKIRHNPNGTWDKSVTVYLRSSGFSGPFIGGFVTREAAVTDAVSQIRSYLTRGDTCRTQADQALRDQIFATLDRLVALNPAAALQASAPAATIKPINLKRPVRKTDDPWSAL
jgi:hypothetical protein